LRGQELVAPELLDLEVVSVLRGQMSAGSLEAGRAELALNDLSAMPSSEHRKLRENLTPYDASYIALAEALDVPPC
jgi:predicted nucleic acid-binding protein